MTDPKACSLFVACADSREIQLFHMDVVSGRLAEVERFGLPGEAHTMAVSLDRDLLVAASRPEPYTLVSYRIRSDGRLSAVGTAPLPGGATYLSFDRSGRFVFMASYGDNLLSVSEVDRDGRPSAPRQVLDDLPHAHAAITDPSNRFVLAPLLGANRVECYRLDPGSGQLTPNVPSTVAAPAGAGPRHPVWHPDGRHLFCINELDGSISVYGFDASAGRLTLGSSIDAMPQGFTGKPWSADLRVTPDGRFLFGCDRRSSTLSRMAFDHETGRLTLLGVMPTESQPRGLAMARDGRFLLAAGQLSNHVTVYGVDVATGALEAAGRYPTGRNPLWLELVPQA